MAQRARLLIDGNNAWHGYGRHTATAVGRHEFAMRVGRWAQRTRTDVTIVFDGPAATGGMLAALSRCGAAIRFGGSREADELIEEEIAGTKAPDMLCVVTDDKAIRSAARRRRCRTLATEDFAALMVDIRTRPTPGPPAEEKPAGSQPGQTDDWMREFGFDEK